ncbi:UbiA-like protein EboC [Maribacter sp. 2-571]|uniref:UbiA-like protein EboC n=1 Tax=Maribacter sp. 2-571 TaxID=3417569 RepID=UPI003D33FD51
MNAVLKGYFRLARPANLPTAAADIFAGMALAGMFSADTLPSHLLFPGSCLVLASILLYAGGVVLNDVFDHRLDAVERPERPIPSGLVSLRSASSFGAILLILGIGCAFLVHSISGFIALALAFSIVLYDGVAKKHAFLGPLNMGFCRSLNLVLGMSLLGNIPDLYWLAGIPLIYIFAITLISRGEVHGNNKKHLLWAATLYGIVVLGVVGGIFLVSGKVYPVVLFLVMLAVLVYRPLVAAYRENTPTNIKKAVISGVLSLIVLDAAFAVGFAPWWYGLLILLLWPLSVGLSKLFAVT